MKIDTTGILAEIKANRKKLDECERHLVYARKREKVGDKHVCERCGGSFDARYLLAYIAGYTAAGGTDTDVCPDWHMKFNES